MKQKMKNLMKKAIFLIIIISTIALVRSEATHEYLNDFMGDDPGCHGNIGSGIGTVNLTTNNPTNIVQPNQQFIVKVNITGFISPTGEVYIGFVNETAKEDNTEFTIHTDWQRTVLDGSGNSVGTIDFVFSAPVGDGVYNIIADVIYGDGLDDILYINGTLDITVETPPGVPIYENFTMTEEPVEVGQNIEISIDSLDYLGGSIVMAKIEFGGINRTMLNLVNNTYSYSFNSSIVGATTLIFTIYLVDSAGTKIYTDSIKIIDTVLPIFFNVSESSESVELRDQVVISIEVYDLTGISTVKIEFKGINYTMTYNNSAECYFFIWTPTSIGTTDYTIYVEDESGNIKSIPDSLEVFPMSNAFSELYDISFWIILQWSLMASFIGYWISSIIKKQSERSINQRDLEIERLRNEESEMKRNSYMNTNKETDNK